MELFANLASTTLNGSISSGALTLIVLSATTFPTAGNFRILVENEIMLVTGVSGNQFTVTRGVEGTAPSNHNTGVLVTQIVTAGAISQTLTDRIGYGTYASRPSTAVAGSRYTASDGQREFVFDGSNWRPIVGGVVGTEVAPGNSIAAYTQVGLAPTGFNVQGGCLYFQKSTVGDNSLCAYEKPKAAGQTLLVHIIPGIFPTSANNTGAVGLPGIYVRDSVGGRLEGTFFGDSGFNNGLNTFNVYQYNTLSSFNSGPAGGEIHPVSDGFWLRILDTGVALKFDWSFDGVNFQTLFTDSTPFVPSFGNRYGVAVDANSVATGMTVDSFFIG